MGERALFHWVDYLVFAVSLAASLGIGVFYACSGGKQKTTREYLMGDRKLGLLPVTVSLLVSFTSATTVMGAPAEMFAYGTQFSMSVFAFCIGCIMGAFFYVPLFYPLKLTSSYEYFELRFKAKSTRLLGSFIMIVTSVFVCGAGVYAPAIALEAVSDLPVWASMTLTIVVVTIYTCIGGIKAVIWTDVFQSIVIFGGLIAVVVLGVLKVGGFGEVWRLNEEYGRIEFFNMDPDPRVRTSFLSVVVLMSFLFAGLTSTQVAVQRYCALPTMRSARTSILLNIPGYFLVVVLCSIVGVVMFAYYAQIGCDPISSGRLYSSNQVLPFFIVDALGYPGLPGIFIACLFSTSLSTISSYLNAIAAVTWEDFMKWKFGKLKAATQARIVKVLVAVYGLISLGLSFVIEQMGGTFIQIMFSILGATAGPLLGMTMLAGLFPRAGPYNTILGVVVALALSIWMAVGNFQLRLYESPLPYPNHNCPNTTTNPWSSYATQGGNMTSYPQQGDNSTMSVNGTGGGGGGGWQWGAPRELHGIENFYAISYLWYPAIAIVCVLVVGALTSYIPGFHQKGHVARKYLFPAVRCCSGICQPPGGMGVVSEDEEDGKVTEDEIHHVKAATMDGVWVTGGEYDGMNGKPKTGGNPDANGHVVPDGTIMMKTRL